jgi:hypothetical protein
VGNAAQTVNGIISTQLLTPMKAVGCDSDDDCPSDTVDVNNKYSFDHSNGPSRFTNYSYVLIGVAIGATLLVTPFLPKSKEECHDWKKIGDKRGNSQSRGLFTLFLAVITLGVSPHCLHLLSLLSPLV